jgi:PAS domain S-box-containing protein
MADRDEESLLRSVALQNASTILLARQHAEEELLRTKEALRESQERLRAALSAAGTGTFRWDLRTNTVEWDGNLDRLFGFPSSKKIQTVDAFIEKVHPDDRTAVSERVEQCARVGADFDIEFRVVWPDGSVHWIADKAKAFFDEHGRPSYVTGACAEITAHKAVEEALRDETRILELLNETGRTLASELSLEAVVQAVTDAATQMSGARFGAFFYNTVDENGQGFQLYTLSGVSRDAFERSGMPRAIALFGPTLHTERPVRCDDASTDPRCHALGSPAGMPPHGNRPVRSVLAVPVTSRSGEAIGALFFGHPEPGVFTERSERLVVGVAAQAAVAMDNARMYEAAQKAAEERRLLLDSERAARTAAERLSDVKDDFLATLSHELRTPLNAILGWAQVLRSSARNETDYRKGLETIERNARLQTRLIDDLLDMSRITSGKLRLDVQPLQPVSFIEAALESVEPAADAKGIRLERVLDPAAGPISGDPGRLQQVIWNLVSNAIKFTPKEGEVKIVLERVNSHIEISVADTGIGIGPHLLPHLFERFRQADASTTRQHGGLGLGLAIVKTLVELHGGTVFARSPGEGLGTTITVQLPLLVVHRSKHAERREHPSTATESAGQAVARELAGLKILVVEDQPDARDLITRVLEDCGANTIAASNADDALLCLEAERPDVLVTDIGMPGVDGFALLRRIRALGPARGGRVPAIALTAFARSEDRTRALRAGFLVHVSKPVDPAELTATVASVARRIGGDA